MSSEEHALRRLEAAYVNLGGLALSRYDGVVDDLTKARAEKAAALDAYRTAIEQRVLAQQPTRVHLAHDERCETCNDVAAWMAKISRERTARQPQETSG